MSYLFISDLHLSQARPEKLALFKRLLEGPAIKAEALYILGDLFDGFWIGCDDDRSPNQEIIDTLKNYSDKPNTKLYLMRGNRDFHLDDTFAHTTGIEFIDDPHLIELDNKRVLLMHGDTLCTDDVKYQSWRRFITNPFIKWLYSIFPLSLRKKIAGSVRSYTVEATKRKSPEITDVSIKTVIKTMKQYNADVLIHGHTHRQAMHDVNLDGVLGKRIVLGDWYEKDCVLIYENNEFQYERIEDYINNN